MKKIDEQIKQNIVDRLASDSRVDASNIKVEVNNGVVTLTGKTMTYADKIDAENITWYVAGVTSIDNQLNVEFSPSFVVPTDEDIKVSIEQKLKWNSEVDQNKVTVKVDNGQVTLEGSVPTYWEKVEAETEASRTTGATLVTNKLAVVPTEDISDEIIGENVMDRIEQNAPTYVDDIDVEAIDGRVILNGQVPTYNIWNSINQAAENTFGVKDVEDNINISYATLG